MIKLDLYNISQNETLNIECENYEIINGFIKLTNALTSKSEERKSKIYLKLDQIDIIDIVYEE